MSKAHATPRPSGAADRPVKMTLRQWSTWLGDAVHLAEAPRAAVLPTLEIARAIRRGALRVREFRAEDGRVFRMIRRAELDAYAASRPRLTLEGMQRAFASLAEDDDAPRRAA